MDFALSPEQGMFHDTVLKFARTELAPGASQRVRHDGIPREVAQRVADLGLMGITFAECDGGAEGTLVDAVLAIRAVAGICPRSADVLQTGNFGPIRTLAEFGSPDQKRRFLGPLLRGEAVISLGMTEPQAGSAVTELETSAHADGDDLVINGTKIFGTHSSEADFFLVYLRFAPGLDGIGCVLIERDTPGFSIGKPSEFMNGEHWSQLYFDDVRIPRANVVLGKGGFRKQIAAFNVERLGNAARAVGVGRCAFDLARDHALERTQFGRPLCEFQGLQWKFADMAVRLESAEMLLMRAAANAGNGLPDAHETAVAKLACNEAGFFAANEAMQIMGAYGFSEESLAQYCMRRTRGWMIAGGSVEVMKNRIAEGIFGRRFSQRP